MPRRGESGGITGFCHSTVICKERTYL